MLERTLTLPMNLFLFMGDNIYADTEDMTVMRAHYDALKGSRKMQVKVARGELSVYPPGGVNVVHIQDVVDCLIKALHLGQVGERYILSGENLLLKDLFERIARIAGVHPPRWKLPKPLILSLGQVGDLMNRCGLKGPLTS